MLTLAELAEAYGRNVAIVKMQIEGISHAESVQTPGFKTNSMNWILGHMLGSRERILSALGAEPTIAAERLTRYARDVEPGETNDEAVPLEELVAALELSQVRMTEALGRTSEADLAREIALLGRSARPLSFWLFFLYFHDTFHTGEMSVLRAALGKTNKVI